MNGETSRRARGCGSVNGRNGRLRRSAMAAALSAALAGAGTAVLPAAALAQAPASTRAAQDYAIPAGNLRPALDALVAQSDISLLYSPDLVADRTTRGATGRLTPAEALRRLLEGTGLESNAVDATTYVLRAGGQTTSPVQAGQERESMQDATTSAQPAEPEVQEIERMTVTGTRIRGGTTPSPVITIDALQIEEEGFKDLGEVIRAVPQNFTGGQNPGVLMGNVAGGGPANQNVTGGSGLNLRGLGPDASLTLLNGRRMSYGGFVQAVDISAIPVEAVERIEIVSDGASAIYGSDAVGGVGNVILKRGYEGATIAARYGDTADGGLLTHEYTATTGGRWSSGGLIATFIDLSSDPIYASQRSYTDHLPEPATIYPGIDLRSGLMSAYQALGDAVEFRVDALRTEREQIYHYYAFSPSTYQDLTSGTTTTLVSPSIDILLPNDWLLNLGGTWGKDERVLDHSMVAADTRLSTPYLYNCHCNESRTYDVGAEGALFALPAGDVRLAAGAGYRRNEYAYPNYLSGIVAFEGDEGVRFAYAEFDVPLISEESGTSGVRQLGLTAAVRSEDYDSFGAVTTPKFGLLYGPTENATLKTSWGRSFKAPTLYQRNYSQNALLDPPSYYGGVGFAEDATALYINGGNPELGPERARTWTTTLAFHPAMLSGLEAEVTWFDIKYSGRVVQPIANAFLALSSPMYAEFVDYYPTEDRLSEIIAGVEGFYNFTDAPYDPENVAAIIDGRYVNVTRQRIRGLDLAGSYRFDLGAGQMTIRGSASWLDSSQQTPGAPSAYDLAGTLHNPAKVNGRAGVVWSRGGVSASAFANYVGGVTNTLDGDDGASLTTVDASLRYRTSRYNGVLSGVELALAVSNVFNREPPRYVPVGVHVAPYDSTNYSAIGRLQSLSISKHW